MNIIILAVSRWIGFKMPVGIVLKECEARSLYHLYMLNIAEYNSDWKQKIDTAIVRLISQIDMDADCSCTIKRYLISPEDKIALVRLCNNYCMAIAHSYFKVAPFGRVLIEAKYIDIHN